MNSWLLVTLGRADTGNSILLVSYMVLPWRLDCLQTYNSHASVSQVLSLHTSATMPSLTSFRFARTSGEEIYGVYSNLFHQPQGTLIPPLTQRWYLISTVTQLFRLSSVAEKHQQSIADPPTQSKRMRKQLVFLPWS